MSALQRLNEGGEYYGYDIRGKEKELGNIKREFEKRVGRNVGEMATNMATENSGSGIRTDAFQTGQGVQLDRSRVGFDRWDTHDNGRGLEGFSGVRYADLGKLIQYERHKQGIMPGFWLA